MTEKIGLEAIWSNENFNKGNAEYMSKMLQSQSATGAITGAMNQMGMNAQGAGGLISSLATTLGMSTTGMVALGAAIGVGIGAFKAISAAVSEFVDFMIMGEDSAIRVASRVQELNFAAQAMGQQVGMSGVDIQGLVKQLTDMEISGTDANQVIADFARYNLDMSKIIPLATVAENASILANKSATETFADLSTGIQRMMVRQLKSSGIVMNAADAYQKYADAHHIVKEAMTETEQQQAFLDEVIAKGANLVGLHAVAMRTAAEQMDHFSAKVIPDLKNALGAPFQAAFYNVIKGISDMVASFTKMISVGGSLYPLMVDLGAIFKIMTEPLLGLSNALTDFVDNRLGGFSNGLMTIINNALTWGSNLVINFANGMINAAATVLTTAINYISSILSYWFAPGSPPRIVPKIDVWGSETMNEYLKGFTDADFNILKEVQQPMEQIFGSLTDMGNITKQAASQLYVDLSEGMIKALAGGGLTNDLLAQLTTAGGIYGDELADLAKKEFALAGSEQAVIDAEKALTNAKKRETDAGVAVNQGISEYNQMLRGGASKQALAAKLAQINASKKEQTMATKDIGAKQTALDLAKQQLIATQDQLKAIKDMITVMIDLNKQQLIAATPPVEPTTPAEKAAAAGKAGAGAVPVTPTGEPFDPTKISDALSQAVDDAMLKIQAMIVVKWSWIKFQIITAWEEAMWKIRQALDKSGLTEKWEEIKKAAVGAWEWIQKQVSDVIFYLSRWWSQHGADIIFVFQKVANFIGSIFKILAPGLIATAAALWNGLIAGVKIAWAIIWGFIKMALEIIGGIFSVFADIFRGDWSKVWEDVKSIFVNVWRIAQQTVNTVLGAIGTYISDTMATIHAIWGETWDKISTKVTEIWDAIKKWIGDRFGEINTTIVTIVTDISAKWTTFWDDVNKKVTDIWTDIKKWVGDKIAEVQSSIKIITDDIKLKWDTFWDDVSKKVTEIWDAIVKGVSDKIQSVKDTIDAMFNDPATGIFAKLGGWVTNMITFGQDLINGLATGVQNVIDTVIGNITGAVQSIIDAIRTLLGIAHSPSELMKTFAKDVWKGFTIGLETNVNEPRKAFQNAMMRTIAPAAAVPITMGATNNYYQPSFNMPVTVNNGMNAAVFQASVKKIVRTEINRK